MTKSIESMWKEGFINEKSLVAPKVNDIYNLKSQNIVDKIKRRFELNLKGIVIFAIILLVVLVNTGAPFLGLYVMGLLLWSVVLGKKQLKAFKKIDKGDNCYNYLKQFDSWLKNLMAEYIKIYRVIYPMLFLGCAVSFYASSVGQSIVIGFSRDFPSVPLIFGIPSVFIGILLIILFLLTYFTGPLYRADMKSLYGRQFTEFEGIIHDVEALKAGS